MFCPANFVCSHGSQDFFVTVRPNSFGKRLGCTDWDGILGRWHGMKRALNSESNSCQKYLVGSQCFPPVDVLLRPVVWTEGCLLFVSVQGLSDGLVSHLAAAHAPRWGWGLGTFRWTSLCLSLSPCLAACEKGTVPGRSVVGKHCWHPNCTWLVVVWVWVVV